MSVPPALGEGGSAFARDPGRLSPGRTDGLGLGPRAGPARKASSVVDRTAAVEVELLASTPLLKSRLLLPPACRWQPASESEAGSSEGRDAVAARAYSSADGARIGCLLDNIISTSRPARSPAPFRRPTLVQAPPAGSVTSPARLQPSILLAPPFGPWGFFFPLDRLPKKPGPPLGRSWPDPHVDAQALPLSLLPLPALPQSARPRRSMRAARELPPLALGPPPSLLAVIGGARQGEAPPAASPPRQRRYQQLNLDASMKYSSK
ncbi:hypothetical protein CDD83_4021 [Cordyceps sp. RAO-2017]|nr:hypothetical protein CDD83_4021 [Cordyceps sp. RAO-2017]